MLEFALAAYTDSLAAHPEYLAWLLRNPSYGARRLTAAGADGVRTA